MEFTCVSGGCLDGQLQKLLIGNAPEVTGILKTLSPLIAQAMLNTPLPIGDNDVFEERCTLPQIAILSGNSLLAELLVRNRSCDVSYSKNCSFFAWGDEQNAAGAGFMENVTPLWCAAYVGNARIAKLLLRLGADVDCQTKCGTTPLKIAALNGHLETVKLLLAAGANLNLPSKDGSLPIHAACWSQRLHANDVIDALLSSADEEYIDSRNKNHETPAYIASGVSLDMLKHLAERGADLSIPDRNGRTCFIRSVVQAKADIAEYLLSLPSTDLRWKAKNGKQALDYAIEAGHTVLAQLIRDAVAKCPASKSAVRFYI